MVVILSVILSVLLGCQASEVRPRPLYIAGYMANSIADVDDYIRLGANVIEADLMFDEPSGHATEFFEGFPCDCFRLCHKRENVVNYMEHFREITTPGNSKFKSSFTGILWIDAHLHKTKNLQGAGKDMASVLDRYLFSTDNIAKVVFEVTDVSFWPFIESLVQGLKARDREDLLQGKIGVSAAKSSSFSDYVKLASKLDIPLWLGDGVSNCLEMFFKLDDVRKACKLRDSGIGVSKVVRWAVDMQSNIRNALWLGVDVVGTNDVHDVLAVMKEPDFKLKYRLATSEDDPFDRVKGHGSYRYGCYKNTCWRDRDLNGKWCYVKRSCQKDASVCVGSVDMKCT